MSAPAAITATLVDVRNVAQHKCVRLEVHVPVEKASAVMAAFGWPTMVEPVHVAIASLDLSKSNENIEKQKRQFAELPIAQQAALLCNREAFWRFLCEREGHNFIPDETSAADALRAICGISSRSELSTNARAAGVFQTLSHEFEDWLREPL